MRASSMTLAAVAGLLAMMLVQVALADNRSVWATIPNPRRTSGTAVSGDCAVDANEFGETCYVWYNMPNGNLVLYQWRDDNANSLYTIPASSVQSQLVHARASGVWTALTTANGSSLIYCNRRGCSEQFTSVAPITTLTGNAQHVYAVAGTSVTVLRANPVSRSNNNRNNEWDTPTSELSIIVDRVTLAATPETFAAFSQALSCVASCSNTAPAGCRIYDIQPTLMVNPDAVAPASPFFVHAYVAASALTASSSVNMQCWNPATRQYEVLAGSVITVLSGARSVWGTQGTEFYAAMGDSSPAVASSTIDLFAMNEGGNWERERSWAPLSVSFVRGSPQSVWVILSDGSIRRKEFGGQQTARNFLNGIRGRLFQGAPWFGQRTPVANSAMLGEGGNAIPMSGGIWQTAGSWIIVVAVFTVLGLLTVFAVFVRAVMSCCCCCCRRRQAMKCQDPDTKEEFSRLSPRGLRHTFSQIAGLFRRGVPTLPVQQVSSVAPEYSGHQPQPQQSYVPAPVTTYAAPAAAAASAAAATVPTQPQGVYYAPHSVYPMPPSMPADA